ncbi:hypothetical protein [Paenibacillus odorifer]|uniref:hypothetical protein n=1 Tax=Paenibacillus odorifer TaxID=189426 RepID=UPI00096FB63D|nr:hypothetical protein [Paenibacillus odorifer]OME55134.1 hypothetical protein BSK61_13790 [Paenibacillus odorifer]
MKLIDSNKLMAWIGDQQQSYLKPVLERLIEEGALENKPGDIYQAKITTIKNKKGIPTVIEMDGRIYTLQPSYEHKEVKKNAKR